MTLIRRPIKRARRRKITDTAIQTFVKMQNSEQQCTCDDDDGPECATCDEWWKQHSVLHRELRLLPNQWPVYARPDEPQPYPESTDADGPVRRYRQLRAAAGYGT
jgi:hypothetical protein